MKKKPSILFTYALDYRINFLDTADMYGNGHNERLISKALTFYKRTTKAMIASKFGIVNGDVIDKSLKRLNLECLNLY
ncbi:aldo/keto reductase [Niallia sp. 01092]|uniref:aldo/keto reductase n=1 Tax=unclassified Niallia TaxID=2837522 RepID=UPI003FD50436